MQRIFPHHTIMALGTPNGTEVEIDADLSHISEDPVIIDICSRARTAMEKGNQDQSRESRTELISQVRERTGPELYDDKGKIITFGPLVDRTLDDLGRVLSQQKRP